MRRTELTVIELYEGLQQTSVEEFNSFIHLKEPLQVLSQSYVFPQGVDSMAVSETGYLSHFIESREMCKKLVLLSI